ncbi:Nuclear polyadenylated RNA-binding protein NAB2 [Escovopsis weberi]|uniref:Nuclear polyadenylated RNA-binding protein NAB2 n=1 Tax=Escovopsis weberi TaxID=150374 RepID=A0A0M8N1C8_ESCWE|nr:Nuclear polyadenylated RNA-binding protein NAB2 [Escovopsis weberi]
MSVEISLNTPLAEALNAAIQPKLVEVGWGTGGSDDSALSEYIILMLVNGKTRDQIASELSNDLLNLGPDDPGVIYFTKWLFDQISLLSSQGQPAEGDVMPSEGGAPGEMETDMGSNDVSELNAPTGPRSMRNGNFRGGREKRMFNNINKSMDRSSDNVLHRVRQTGNERINTHARGLPAGPRLGPGAARQPRNMNGTNMNSRGMMPGAMPGGMPGAAAPGFGQWPMQGQPNQMDVMAILEQQSQMMLELSQQMISGANRGYGQQRRGKSLFERTQNPRHKDGSFRRQHNNNNQHSQGQGQSQGGDPNAPGGGDDAAMETGEGGEDVDASGGKREPPNPDETVCKYNLYCTNKDCRYAHQSPAAPPGASVDVNDACSFGAACKNRKCVGRHPSPAARLAHQSEQDCRFFPNCQNPRCAFRHPSMPLCRNGADCTAPGCKFTHVTTKCKFNPCMNPSCAFAHEPGQQGGYKDKVWTSEEQQGHVSERKFVDDGAAEEFVKPETEADAQVIV